MIKKFICSDGHYSEGVQHGVQYTGSNAAMLQQLVSKYGSNRGYRLKREDSKLYLITGGGSRITLSKGAWLMLDIDGRYAVFGEQELPKDFVEADKAPLSYIFGE